MFYSVSKSKRIIKSNHRLRKIKLRASVCLSVCLSACLSSRLSSSTSVRSSPHLSPFLCLSLPSLLVCLCLPG